MMTWAIVILCDTDDQGTRTSTSGGVFDIFAIFDDIDGSTSTAEYTAHTARHRVYSMIQISESKLDKT